MPRMDGLEFLRVVKEDARWKMIPVLMLTSSDADNDINACYGLHANCYIIKPQGLTKFVEAAKQIEIFWAGLAKLPLRAVG